MLLAADLKWLVVCRDYTQQVSLFLQTASSPFCLQFAKTQNAFAANGVEM